MTGRGPYRVLARPGEVQVGKEGGVASYNLAPFEQAKVPRRVALAGSFVSRLTDPRWRPPTAIAASHGSDTSEQRRGLGDCPRPVPRRPDIRLGSLHVGSAGARSTSGSRPGKAEPSFFFSLPFFVRTQRQLPR